MKHLSKVLFSFLLLVVFCFPSQALTVPDSECPTPATPTTPPLCYIISETCHRTDGPITNVNQGSPSLKIGATNSCYNCCSCPDETPPPMTCVDTLEVSFTETVTASIATGIQVGVPVLKTSLEASIGHATARTFSNSISCGTNSLPDCDGARYGVGLDIVSGIVNQMTHTFQWLSQFELIGDGYCSPPQSTTGGTRNSIVSGNVYDGSSSCEYLGALSCDVRG